MIKRMPVADLRENPNNPRTIKDDKFRKLVESVKDFPEMLEARPIVCTSDGVVLGGNMRLKALREAGIKETPVYVVKWTENKQSEFLIKDNVGFGEWDWDILANEWDAAKLEEWGLDVWQLPEDEPTLDELLGEDKNKPATMKITFKDVEHLQDAENEIQELIDRKYPGAFYSVSAGEI